MRVGLVRNVGLSAVALLALGLAGCDDNPLEFEPGVAVRINTNPSAMIVPAGLKTRLISRTVDAGSRPTLDDITAAVDATCGGAAITIVVADDFEPELQASGVFDVTGGNTLGETCIELTGGGVTASVDVTVVGDSLEILGVPVGSVLVFDAVQLSAVLRADDGTAVGPFDPLTDIVWSSDALPIAAVDQTGLVTTGPKGGGAIITAVWSDAGVSVSAEATIDVNIPIPVLTSVDVTNAQGGDLVTITGTGFIGSGAGLIDAHRIFIDGVELQDTTITVIVGVDTTTVLSSQPTIVDGTTATFLMPLGPAGDVDITIGSVCCLESNALVVTRDAILVPTLVSTDIGNGNAGDLVTVTGTDFFLGNDIVPLNGIFVDGVVLPAAFSPTIVNTTTATFNIPQGAIGDFDIQIGDPLVALSNVLMVTRDTQDEEPANDDPSTAGLLPALPVSLTRRIGMGDADDFYLWSPAAAVTVNLDLSWIGASGDLDLLFTDAAFTAYFPCYDLATGAVPESGQCTFPAGDYAVWVNDFAGASGITEYLLEMVAVP